MEDLPFPPRFPATEGRYSSMPTAPTQWRWTNIGHSMLRRSLFLDAFVTCLCGGETVPPLICGVDHAICAVTPTVGDSREGDPVRSTGERHRLPQHKEQTHVGGVQSTMIKAPLLKR